MTGQEAVTKLARELSVAREEGKCTSTEYINTYSMYETVASQWSNNKDGITEDQYNNVWNVLSAPWVGKELPIH